MALSLAQKLRIKVGAKLLTVHAPADFKTTLSPLPAGVQIATKGTDYRQIHWFVKNKAEMERDVSRIMNLIKEDVICWIYYPKGTSKIQTDLTRDKGWESLMKHKELQWLSLISFDDTWASFAMRLKTEADKKKKSKPVERTINEYINPATKTVRLPDDLANVLKKNKHASVFFETLSFTNRKEYVEWVVSAKREETRNERVQGTIERLGKKWKNPRIM
jgi:hypothetical protein